MQVSPGLEQLLLHHLAQVQGRRVGLITNASSVLPDLTDTQTALHAIGVCLVALFSPEHGLYGVEPDGAAVTSGRGPEGLPVYSLYGETCRPTPEMLASLDVLLFDIQDVGARFYTYIWTMSLALEAAAEAGLAFIVLDRPNPLGGQASEGPVLEPEYASFVGRHPIPIRYGLTIGELAGWLNGELNLGADLTVVPMQGWRREMFFEDTGLPWVPPSPAMPWPASALVYPGTCLIEGTNLSEGRGTALPFHLVGAPWIDGRRLADALNRLELAGVRFRPAVFQPAAHKWAGQRCGGVQLHATDRRAFRPVTAGLHVLATVRALYPDRFAWRQGSEEGERPHIDLLSGTDRVRLGLDHGASVADLVASWAAELDQFARNCRPYRLYA
jgi:uncharacterized protein YbbC (DUF1343 family)